ncbi:MAG: DUF448 domain-containing protein [Janthinobacterium lividum]
MRNPRNEPDRLDGSPTSRTGDDPVRSCILSREKDARDHLVRLALGPDGRVWPDVRAKAPGRGAWIGVTRAELDAAIAKGRLKGALARAFKTAEFTIPPDLSDQIGAALERAALDRLGLEAKSGTLLSGSERIEAAARSGQLHALYHAADASADGRRKLAQAWRVGEDEEGSGRQGLALPVARPTLSLALGRENVVHIGLTDRAAAKRVGDMLDRWLHFIGPSNPDAPCETASQGATAAGPSNTDGADTHQAVNARGI